MVLQHLQFRKRRKEKDILTSLYRSHQKHESKVPYTVDYTRGKIILELIGSTRVFTENKHPALLDKIESRKDPLHSDKFGVYRSVTE